MLTCCHCVEKHIGKHERCCLNDGDAVSMIKCQFYFLLPTSFVKEEKSTAVVASSGGEKLSMKRPNPEIVDLTKKVETSQE